jgi:cytosine/adenosine deaminase-related metal-dependent hydrolase
MFAAGAADVSHVVVDGRVIVVDGEHLGLNVPAELARSIGALT